MMKARCGKERGGCKSAGRASRLALAAALTAFVMAGSSPVFAKSGGKPTEPAASAQRADTRPNILVIVADDLGYSDIGAFGGEIATPNLDALAMGGTRAANFYVAPACSPTRSMLLTGRDNHTAGFGTMQEVATPDQRGAPGYEGYLPRHVDTIAERLRDSGYQTMMAGKWHLGAGPGQGPSDRGFSQSFALLQGAHNHFGADQSEAFKSRGIAGKYRLNGAPADWPAGQYSSDVFVNYLSDFLDRTERSQPFFAYLAFTAPHWPLQARPATIARYRGVYDAGPDAIVRARMQRMAEKGLIRADMATRALGQQAWWDSLSPEQRAVEARKMEVFAAMVDDMDSRIGKVLAKLRADGRLDNTIILFMSDNGPEGLVFDRLLNPSNPGEVLDLGVDNSLSNLGAPNSYISYGPRWGQVSAAPYWGTKEHTSEGGIRAPLIVNGPGIAKQALVKQPIHVMDLKPTLLAAAGLREQKVAHAGQSRLPVLSRPSGKPARAGTVMNWELFYRSASRIGDMKAIYQPTRIPIFGEQTKPGEVSWQLYDLANDPGETRDLALVRPGTLKRLKKQWRDYARKVGVVLLPEDR